MDTTSLVALTLYALLFWLLGLRFPALALALVFGLGPFQNDVGGGLGGLKFSLSEVNLLLCLPLLAHVL